MRLHTSPGRVVAGGRIEPGNASALDRALRAAWHSGPIVVDLRTIAHIEPAGVSVLLDDSHGQLQLLVTTDSVLADLPERGLGRIPLTRPD